MSKYRTDLPQLNRLFLTDGGMETDLIFNQGIDLPCFSAIDLMKRPGGSAAIKRYFEPYIQIAQSAQTGLILETPTWRASPDWFEGIGFQDLNALRDANLLGLELMSEIRANSETPQTPMVISGCVGPRGDGYAPDATMTIAEAEDYHTWQVAIMAGSAVDIVTAMTMNTTNEAVGIARAAKAQGVPAAISFTVETDGRLPTGQSLGDAIEEADAETGNYPAYYMINCAHPTHFAPTLDDAGEWIGRVRGVRANASKLSHAELDCACELDDGNPVEFGEEMTDLLGRFPHMTVLGGCCGTDHRHIAAIANSLKWGLKAA
ncbi:MAG: homocysteine S-methyltransferase family protein [Alphaproteobacteria bacterium]|nr:homocysteine S-methyltransferase family protein [Alphaproteobacteria bacterium]